MRFLRKLMIGLGVLAAVPLAAQGPVQQIAAKPAEQAPAVPPPAGAAKLDAADVEAWLDGFMPYALARGEVAGAVVVVVRGGGTVLQKGYGFADAGVRSRDDGVLALQDLFLPEGVIFFRVYRFS